MCSLTNNYEWAVGAQTLTGCLINYPCPPVLQAIDTSASGTGMNLIAGAGKLTFQSSDCAATDLCAVARDVEAIKAKFDTP